MLSNYIFCTYIPWWGDPVQMPNREIGNLGQRVVNKIAAKKVAMLQLLGDSQ